MESYRTVDERYSSSHTADERSSDLACFRNMLPRGAGHAQVLSTKEKQERTMMGAYGG